MKKNIKIIYWIWFSGSGLYFSVRDLIDKEYRIETFWFAALFVYGAASLYNLIKNKEN